ncbi:MAG: M14-type cytosolic carboxypeptidase [Bryobacteraceae bacterium]
MNALLLGAAFFLGSSVTVSTNFESGSAGKVDVVAPDHLRIAVAGQSDQNHRNRQANWYYFRLDHLPPAKPVTIDLADLLGEYNFKSGTHAVTKNTRPVYSYDNRVWRHFADNQVSWDDKEPHLTLRFTPGKSTVWIAHLAPYTNEDLENLLRRFRANPDFKQQTIGKTVQGRNLLLLTVTDPSVPDSGKKAIWLMARQHAWETGTSWDLQGALEFLLSHQPDAARIRRSDIFKIIPMADPDGVANGGVRFNANGYDLNRNWDSIDPKLMPEIAAQHQAASAWIRSGHRIDIFLTLHNTESADHIETEMAEGGPQLKALANCFWTLLDKDTTFYSPGGPRESGATTTSGMKGRMTVYQGLFHDFKIPAFLMEQMVESSPRLKRCPTVEDRLTFGAGLVRVLSAAVAR